MAEWTTNDELTAILCNRKMVYVGAGAPGTLYDGQVWIDTTEDPCLLKVYDLTNTQWVEHHGVFYETQSGAWAAPSDQTAYGNGDIVVLYNSTQAGTRLYAYSNGGWDLISTTPTTSSSIFGTGIDGPITIAAPTQLTRNMDYTNLTVNDTLDTAGFIVRCSGTLDNNSTISDEQSGGASGAGGAGGTGGTGNGNTGSVGAAGSAPSEYGSAGTGGSGGGGGGQGASDDASDGTIGGVGGAGGKGGGIVIIYCSVFDNTGGTIEVNGSAGSNGNNGSASGTGKGTGGGGGTGAGGDGGTVEIYYGTLTALGTVTSSAGAAGGTGGAGGTATGSRAAAGDNDGGTGGAGGGSGGAGGAGGSGNQDGSTGANSATAGGGGGGGGGGGYDDNSGDGWTGGTGGLGSAGTAGTVITEAVA